MINKKSFIQHPDFKEGEVLLINKDLDWTSFDVVNSLKIYLKYEFGIKKIKIGHAGTLDPRATGLVIVCTGKQTKSIDTYQAREKEYTGSFRLGHTTPSWDGETEPDQQFSTEHISGEMIRQATKQFTGTILQTPPIFSALKVDGKRAYKFARSNQEVTMQQRQVEVFDFEITRIEMPLVFFRVRCSKGTYIRSLANDFGIALGSGAYLSSLHRTAIGEFRVEDALTISEFKQLYRQNSSVQE
ncbi:MAG: tRNA pseudouridine(55) synthase TruB [Bacteroidales bacterium]|nr:tRNA pseudouridine(55) synthase TruB [Bacteroidales bacterium]